MQKITVLLADDESHARERLRDLLSIYEQFEIIIEALDGNEALQYIISHEPDVAFLDINMPGISVFQSVPSLKNPPLIVFQTAYSEHAAEAFDLNAVDYIMKPVRKERFAQTIDKILKEMALKDTSRTFSAETKEEQVPEKLSIKVQGRIEFIPVKEIVCISFEDGFSTIYTANERYLSDKYLNYYEELLAPAGFFRSSRNDIINLAAVKTILSPHQGLYEVELTTGMSVDLSRRKAQALKKLMAQ